MIEAIACAVIGAALFALVVDLCLLAELGRRK